MTIVVGPNAIGPFPSCALFEPVSHPDRGNWGGSSNAKAFSSSDNCRLCGPDWFAIRAAQTRVPGAVYDFDRKGETPAPAPKRDISGIWEPASSSQGGIQGKGAAAMESCKRDPKTGRYSVDPHAPVTDTGYATPDCVKPDTEPPYTDLGRKRSWPTSL